MAIAFPDLPQGPVHRFFHKIALICGILLDQWEKGQKRLVRGSLVVNRQFSHQHKTRSPHKLLLPVAPFHCLLIGIGGLIKAIPADLVADVPRIEIVDPLLRSATVIARATWEPARGTCHRPAGGRPRRAARRRPAIPDRRAFPGVAHPRAGSPICGTAAPQPGAAPGSQPAALRGWLRAPRCADLWGSPRGARIVPAQPPRIFPPSPGYRASRRPHRPPAPASRGSTAGARQISPPRPLHR